MKKLLICAVAALSVLAAVIGCGKTKTPVQETTAEGTSVTVTTHAATTAAAASTAAVSTTKAAASSAAAGTQNSISGVVIDATMNMLTIQSEHGTTLTFAVGDDTAPEKVDKSGVKDGIALGHALKVTCRNAVDEKDASKNIVTKLEDARAKSSDYDALAAAGSIILIAENKDLTGLASLCAYPVYVGVGNGATVKDQKEFEKNYKAADIFSDAFVKSVSSVNLMEIGESDAGMVISADGAKPNVIISKTDDGWNVTGINTAK